MWEIMYTIMCDALDILCSFTIKKIRTGRPCWLTNEVKRKMKERDELYKKQYIWG